MIYSIGHSTRALKEFLALLRAHEIGWLADIRTVPRSRRHPHFARELLRGAVEQAGMGYRHLPALGGLRHPRKDSPNTGWRNESFRGYADYMQTPAFEEGLGELLELAQARTTAMMCAEAMWWRCHRALVSDALLVRGHDVRHIERATRATPHRLTPFARLEGTRLTYPATPTLLDRGDASET